MSKFLSGRQSKLYVGISSISDEKTVLQVTGKVGIGTTAGQHHSLYVNGSANISDEILVGGGATVVGIASFQSDVFIDNNLIVQGITIESGGTDLDQLNVSGLSTFGNTVDINADLDVDGHTELDNLNVSGVSTFVGITTQQSTLFANQLSVAGISTLYDDLFFRRPDANSLGLQFYDQLGSYQGYLTQQGNGGGGRLNLVSVYGMQIKSTSPLEIIDGSFSTTKRAVFQRGAVELYHSSATGNSSSKKFETTTDGIEITGTTDTDQLIVSGIATFTSSIDANGDLDVDGHTELDNLNVSGVSTFASDLDVNANVSVSGVVTATTFVGDLTGVATTATQLETARNFSVTGDFVTAPAVSFDGTGAVALAATITADSITLGTYTSGDYVESVAGTSNQITVTGGTGESSTPVLSFPNQVTLPQDLTVTRDVQITRNLNVDGNITIGGTSATIFTETLRVSDADLVWYKN